MPKKTARRTPSRRTVSRPTQDSRLIVTARKPKQSAGTKSALDNRSHRTVQFAPTQLRAPRESDGAMSAARPGNAAKLPAAMPPAPALDIAPPDSPQH